MLKINPAIFGRHKYFGFIHRTVGNHIWDITLVVSLVCPMLLMLWANNNIIEGKFRARTVARILAGRSQVVRPDGRGQSLKGRDWGMVLGEGTASTSPSAKGRSAVSSPSGVGPVPAAEVFFLHFADARRHLWHLTGSKILL